MNILRFFLRFTRPRRPRLIAAIEGPQRIVVRQHRALGVEVDVSHLFGHLVRQLAADFVEATEEVGDDLIEIAKLDSAVSFERGRGNDDSRAEHERDELVQKFIDTLGGAEHVLYGRTVRDLAAALMAAGQVVALPGQRGAA